jgi:hypothetical protein
LSPERTSERAAVDTMAIEYRLFYRPAPAEELKKRKVKGCTVSSDGEYLCHTGLNSTPSHSTETFVPHSSAVSLRYENNASGQLDMHIVVPTDDRGMEKYEKNVKPILCLDEDIDTSLESAKFSKIPRPGATVKVRARTNNNYGCAKRRDAFERRAPFPLLTFLFFRRSF